MVNTVDIQGTVFIDGTVNVSDILDVICGDGYGCVDGIPDPRCPMTQQCTLVGNQPICGGQIPIPPAPPGPPTTWTGTTTTLPEPPCSEYCIYLYNFFGCEGGVLAFAPVCTDSCQAALYDWNLPPFTANTNNGIFIDTSLGTWSFWNGFIVGLPNGTRANCSAPSLEFVTGTLGECGNEGASVLKVDACPQAPTSTFTIPPGENCSCQLFYSTGCGPGSTTIDLDIVTQNCTVIGGGLSAQLSCATGAIRIFNTPSCSGGVLLVQEDLTSCVNVGVPGEFYWKNCSGGGVNPPPNTKMGTCLAYGSSCNPNSPNLEMIILKEPGCQDLPSYTLMATIGDVKSYDNGTSVQVWNGLACTGLTQSISTCAIVSLPPAVRTVGILQCRIGTTCPTLWDINCVSQVDILDDYACGICQTIGTPSHTGFLSMFIDCDTGDIAYFTLTLCQGAPNVPAKGDCVNQGGVGIKTIDCAPLDYRRIFNASYGNIRPARPHEAGPRGKTEKKDGKLRENRKERR